MKHFANLILLVVSDWQQAKEANAKLPQKSGVKFGGWLGEQRTSPLIAERVLEIHKDPRAYNPKDDRSAERCAYYLESDQEFVEQIVARKSPEAAKELELFISLPRRAREVVVQLARNKFDGK